MSNGDLDWIANYIWGIADDVLRDLYVRGKYRDASQKNPYVVGATHASSLPSKRR